jgi:hypothetical protein
MRKRIGQFVDLIRTKLKEKKFRNNFTKKAKHFLPVMVFQMGKVASSSIYHSIKNIYKGYVIHFHSFDDRNESVNVDVFYDYSVLKRQPVKIISLTREPVIRNISAFFQNFEYITGTPYSDSAFQVEQIKKEFLENKIMNHNIPLTWFDDNLLKYYGIDVYEKPFPESGWEILKQGNAEVLLMKAEISNDLKASLVKKFLDCNDFVLFEHNTGEGKEYATAYKKFKTEVKLPKEYLDQMLNSRYARHFYSAKEIESSRKKWS